MSSFSQISYSDTGALDAFGRLRISQPGDLFNVQCQYDAEPLFMEAGATGTGVTPAFDSNTRLVNLSATAGSGTSFFQSFQYSPYVPGRSQNIEMTFVIGTGVAGAVVDVGYFDAANGVILRQNGASGLQLILRTSTSGSVSNANLVNQASWNIDKMDGTGPSGITLDVTKGQIFFIDLQFLSMGRVRCGFNINGVRYYVHQFLNSNNLNVPYMQTGTLPVGMLITSTSTAATKTSSFKCATVQTEGGNIRRLGSTLSTPETTATAGNGTRVPLLSIRPKTTFNGITNRSLFIPESLTFDVTGASDVFWELVIGGAYGSQVFADVNTTFSAFEYSSTPGSFTNLTGGLSIDSGHIPGGGSGLPINVPIALNNEVYYPITLNRAGAVRALGTMTLLVTGIGGTSACRGAMTFREIR